MSLTRMLYLARLSGVLGHFTQTLSLTEGEHLSFPAPCREAVRARRGSVTFRQSKEKPASVVRRVVLRNLEQLAERRGDLPEETALLDGAPRVVLLKLGGHALFGQGKGALQVCDLELVLEKAEVRLPLRVRDIVHVFGFVLRQFDEAGDGVRMRRRFGGAGEVKEERRRRSTAAAP